MRNTILQVTFRRCRKPEATKCLSLGRDLAFACLSDSFLLLRLSRPPIGRVQALPESLPVHSKIRVPSLPTFVERHLLTSPRRESPTVCERLQIFRPPR